MINQYLIYSLRSVVSNGLLYYLFYADLFFLGKNLFFYGQVLIMQNGMEIPVTDITGLEGDIFFVLDGCGE